MDSHPIARYTAVILGNAGEYTFEHRIFNGVMALITLTGVSTIAYNLLLGNHYLQTVVSLGCTLFPLWCFLYSKRRKQYKTLVIPAAVAFYLLLCAGYFVTDGVNGSLPFFFVLLVVYCVIFVKRPFVFFVPFVLATVVALALMEYWHPELFIRYATREQRFIDVALSIVLTFSINSLILWVIFNEYKRERNERECALQQAIRDRERIDQAMREIKVLRGFLPICSHCKKIRNTEGQWMQLEAYIHAHSEATFSHGMCGECSRMLYPDLFSNVPRIGAVRDYHQGHGFSG